MIRIYAVDCTPYLDDDAAIAALPRLDEKHRLRARRLRVPLKRAQCVAAGLLLTRLIGENGVPPTLSYNEHGKPHHSNTYFSLSHTGKWIFCALSDHPVGMDAQTICSVSHRLIAHTLTTDEQKWAEEDRNQRFIRLWTMKEAYLKYTGTGLSVPLLSVSLQMPPAEGTDTDLGVHWYFPPFHDSRIILTICGEEAAFAAIRMMDANQL